MNENELKMKEFFNNYKKAYDKTWDPKEHTLHVGLFNKKTDSLNKAFDNSTTHLESLINQYSPLNSKSKILDLCCGTGRTIIKLTSKHNCNATGIDISENQINDANKYNNTKCEFIIDTINNIDKLKTKYTHIISQDGICLVPEKRRCYKNAFKLLSNNGLLVVSDFLSEKPKYKIDAKRKKGIYETVKWKTSLSFLEYEELLSKCGFEILFAEKRNNSMKATYSKLIDNIKPFVNENEIYSELLNRYMSIVKGVEENEIGWGWFVAKKVIK